MLTKTFKLTAIVVMAFMELLIWEYSAMAATTIEGLTSQEYDDLLEINGDPTGTDVSGYNPPVMVWHYDKSQGLLVESEAQTLNWNIKDNASEVWDNWYNIGGQNGTTVTEQTNGDMKGEMADGDGDNSWAVWDFKDGDFPEETSQVYIDLWAKMPSDEKNGVKFVKVFGEKGTNDATANATFGLDYTNEDNGAMIAVAFGDGRTTESTDTGNLIRFDGTQTSNYGTDNLNNGTILLPEGDSFDSADWGTGWHHFKLHVKFNTGTSAATEVQDGAFYVEIDDDVYLNASGLWNRHWKSGNIKRVTLFGHTQNSTEDWELWYKDVKISTTGWPE